MKSIVAISMILSMPLAFAQNKETIQEKADLQDGRLSMDRRWAHLEFGPEFYIPSMNYPVLTPNFPYQPLRDFAIPLKQSAKPNVGADSTNWTPVPFKGKAVYYRAEYHMKDISDIDVKKMIEETSDYYRANGIGTWQLVPAERNEMMRLAKIQMVVFPMEQFQIKYYPGWILFWHENGSMLKPRLQAPRGSYKPEYAKVQSQDIPNLAGILKGAFDNEDTRRGGRVAGTIVDGAVIDAPIGYLQSIAVYADGKFLIGPYDSLPNKAGIKWLRQNELPILLNGELSRGAYPTGWNGYGDHMLRTYIFISRDAKFVGYAWTNYAHPSFTAKLLQKLGMSEMMQLDIHPAIGGALATPSNDANQVPFFLKDGSYPFIPLEADVRGWLKNNLGQWANKNNPIQWPYQTTEKMSTSDFFGVFLK